MAETIVCGVDLTDEQQGTVAVAGDLGRRLGGGLVLVHVMTPEPAAPVPAGTGSIIPAPAPAGAQPEPLTREQQASVEEELRERLMGLARAHGLEDADVDLIIDVRPVDGLRRAAAEHDAILLVVGSHGHGSVHATLLGSVSHALAARAPCPVVIVPPPA